MLVVVLPRRSDNVSRNAMRGFTSVLRIRTRETKRSRWLSHLVLTPVLALSMTAGWSGPASAAEEDLKSAIET